MGIDDGIAVGIDVGLDDGIDVGLDPDARSTRPDKQHERHGGLHQALVLWQYGVITSEVSERRELSGQHYLMGV